VVNISVSIVVNISIDKYKELKISSLGWGKGFQCIMIASPYSGTGAVIMTNSDLGVHQSKGLIGEVAKSLRP
jgi:hypothetical protein